MSFARVRGPGQPDQACDLVAAVVAEEYVRRDPQACLNIRVSGGRGVMFVAGDIKSAADFDVSAVVRRTLGQSGVSVTLEPFVAFEPMSPARALSHGIREPLAVTAYATTETEDRLPLAVSVARDVARELERRRTTDPDWFWLGSDYDVGVEVRSPKSLIVVRAQHAGTKALVEVREQIKAAVADRYPSYEVRVNPAGEEIDAGLEHRMGSSGRTGSVEGYGFMLPSTGSGAGFAITHPLNVGAWLMRAAARELVEGKKGKAIMMQSVWQPADVVPSSLRIRNERGENLSSLLSPARFTINQVPENLRQPSLLADVIRYPYEGSTVLPWERS